MKSICAKRRLCGDARQSLPSQLPKFLSTASTLDVFRHSISKGQCLKTTNLIAANQSVQHQTEFATDVLLGLSANPKTISAKYFYDDVGSELFQKISQHKDYYLTKTEFSILETHADSLVEKINENEIDILELGAGDGHKSKLIIDGFLKHGTKVNFYPIDISEKPWAYLPKT